MGLFLFAGTLLSPLFKSFASDSYCHRARSDTRLEEDKKELQTQNVLRKQSVGIVQMLLLEIKARIMMASMVAAAVQGVTDATRLLDVTWLRSLNCFFASKWQPLLLTLSRVSP